MWISLTGVEVSGAHPHGGGDVVEGDVAPADRGHPGFPPPPRQLGRVSALALPPGGETVEVESVRDFPSVVVVRPAAAVFNAAVSPAHGAAGGKLPDEV